ncbi:helix-turn-helix domain-containing protein [Prosthecobacter sp.]|uniref:helix-turn-helix domain-containing protein n=1 Tax=Prosthecobacter sp. TaxID=1965333 RepID=UPI0037C52833
MKPEPPSCTPELLTPAQLAARWSVTTVTLRRWRRLGRIQAIHLGRGVRFSLSDVERFETQARA